MASTASMKAARGTKRTCQNSECGSRFYDLGRDPVICPICNTEYALAVASPAAIAAAQQAADEKAARRAAKKAEEATASPELAAVEGDEALAAIEGDEDVEVGETDETFLEEEEDEGSDVSGIIGGGGEPEEET